MSMVLLLILLAYFGKSLWWILLYWWNPLFVKEFYNSVHIIQQTDLAAPTAITATYDKFHLVPFGEYLPAAWLLESFGLKKMVYGDASGYSEGPGPPGRPDLAPAHALGLGTRRSR